MITFDHVSKTYPGGKNAVCDFSMEVNHGETVVLLGTSGSGKTTILKMVNRLVEPTSGRILIEGTDIMEQNPIQLRRKIGYAIQHIGLLPHMTVSENIGIVPSLLKWNKKDIERRCDELLKMVGLNPDEFRNRYPSQLSGGQRQRVGVARAIAQDPPVILMDEPFGALDPITREQLQNEFLDLKSKIKKTIIFVTHDVFEAVKMGDRITLLDEGCLQQISTPRELVENPANDFVEQFLGKHRFQLSLLTRTIRDLLSYLDMEGNVNQSLVPEVKIDISNSLLDVLDTFKKFGCETLPVYDDENFVGIISRNQIALLITRMFQGDETKDGDN